MLGVQKNNPRLPGGGAVLPLCVRLSHLDSAALRTVGTIRDICVPTSYRYARYLFTPQQGTRKSDTIAVVYSTYNMYGPLSAPRHNLYDVVSHIFIYLVHTSK